MRNDTRYDKLEALGDWQLENSSQDIRGRPLVSPDGQRYGIIKELLVDRERGRVAAIRLEDGRTTAIEPLEIHDNAVVYGDAARAHADTGAASGHVVEEEVVPLVEERVAVGKRVADHGREIRVTTGVVSERVAEDVHLRDETVSVDTRPVERRVSTAEAESLLNQADRTVSMTEHDEEAVVAKDAVVTGEVVVKKTAADRVEHVEETVRKTTVDVDDGTGTRRT